jgi:CRISPR system Cascade subunit CasB
MARQHDELAAVVDSLAGTIGHEAFPKGELAELRRLRPEAPPPAFWRLLAAKVPRELCADNEAERAWAVVMQGLAIMAPKAHAPGTLLGSALGGLGDTAESRLWKFLNSRGELLEDQVRLMARFLSSKNRRLDWSGIARLLLTRSEEDHERICRAMARSFFFSDRKPETGTPE